MKIVLVGQPNVGKSVIFNALTGTYATVSNYPGTTVEIAKGHTRHGGERFTVIDTPGVNSLKAGGEDERVTVDILKQADISCIAQVADSKNLRRALLLTAELGQLGIPLVLDLNMRDEALERGIEIDAKKLSDLLGIPVVETVAVTGGGIAQLKEAVFLASKGRAKDAFREAREHALFRQASVRARIPLVDGLARATVKRRKGGRSDLSQRIGQLAVSPVTGTPILLAVLFLMYAIVGRVAAGAAVDFLAGTVFGRFVNPFFIRAFSAVRAHEFVRDLFVGQYGLITMAMTYSLAIVLPIVAAFFVFFGVLEDSGYLPRLSVLSDRLFRRIGLNGKAVLPVVLGLGCGTMATLTSRILESKKERILVTLILALAIPCSAQLGVIMGMLGGISLWALLWWVAILVATLVVVGAVADKAIPGSRSPFVQELPPMRVPQARNILSKTGMRLLWYIKEAVPLFVAGTAALFVLDKFGALRIIEHVASPLVEHLLGLPAKVTGIFILGFLRRDYGTAGLYAMAKEGALDHIQVLVSAVVITLFVPCIAQLIVMVKERGFRIGIAITAFVSIFAFCVGGAVNFLFRQAASLGIRLM